MNNPCLRTRNITTSLIRQYKVVDMPGRQFDAPTFNQVWCGDVTYIWAGKRCAYLADEFAFALGAIFKKQSIY